MSTELQSPGQSPQARSHDALEELRSRVMHAHQTQQALQLSGAGTKAFYGEPLTGDPLELTGHRGILAYEPSELVLTARCGTPLSQIEQALKTEGQCLAFEPPAFGGDPTMGGMIAAGLSGPRRAYAGAARDFVLGAVLLGGDGELLRFGGQVMKNVAGFDVARLLCGSLGILGVITEVSIKVLPLPQSEETRCLEMSQEEAITAFNRWAGQPMPLSASAWHEGRAWVRLSGAEPAVKAACERIGGDRPQDPEARAWWEALRHGKHPVLASNALWRLSVPATAPPLTRLRALDGEPLMEWGGALRWYPGEHDTAQMRELARKAGGTALCWRGPAPQGRFHPLPPAVLAIQQRLKARFDPHGIFNPGRMYKEL